MRRESHEDPLQEVATNAPKSKSKVNRHGGASSKEVADLNAAVAKKREEAKMLAEIGLMTGPEGFDHVMDADAPHHRVRPPRLHRSAPAPNLVHGLSPAFASGTRPGPGFWESA